MSTKKEMTPEEYEAWCEWRKWCSVFRVKKPNPTQEEIDSGKIDDIEENQRNELYLYLSRTIVNVISRRLRNWYENPDLHDDSWGRQCPTTTETNKKWYLSCFDEWMNGEKKAKPAGFEGNSYKDYIFYNVENEPSGCPGKVIFGKIFHKRKGYVNEIITKILKVTEELDRGPRGGYKKKTLNITSLDSPIESDDPSGKTLLDTLGEEDDRLFEEDEIITEKVYPGLSREEKLILAAFAYGVAISNPQLLDVLHCRKERAANLKNRLFLRLRSDLPGVEYSKKPLTKLLDLIFPDLEAENETKSFLLSIQHRKEGGAK